MDGDTEDFRGHWPWWCRIARHDPATDDIHWSDRAPRRADPNSKGCLYTVPARDGAVLVLVHEHDYRRNYERTLARVGGEWKELPRDDAWEVLAPGIHERRRAREAARAAADEAIRIANLPYQVVKCLQPKGRRAPKVADGIQQDTADTWVLVSDANGTSYRMRRLKDWEIERHLSTLAADEAAPAA
ncbi:hypothetical protein ACLBXO_16345 [Methylobacterium sp. C33D]